MNPHQIPLHLQPNNALHLHTLPTGLQTLEAITPEASDAFFQHQQRYAQHLNGSNSHALHFTGHGLQATPAQYQPFAEASGYDRAYELRTAVPQPPLHKISQPTRNPFQLQQPIIQAPGNSQPRPVADLRSFPLQLTEQPQPPIQDHNSNDVLSGNQSHFEGFKLIPNPPDLDAWREKIFAVDDMITLNEEQFQTYFPHVDNVYSHRSTQRHKRKRFISHYWDCRLKGRPAGTKKSTDPDKKKRKRVARERDLCDVKIKIMEYFDAAELLEQTGQQPPEQYNSSSLVTGNSIQSVGQQTSDVGTWELTRASGTSQPLATAAGQKYYTIQRVNGNGGKGDEVAGPHKHTLEESDRVKKNSVMRWIAKNEKEKKKSQGGDPSKKTYHKKATGAALTTVKSHAKDEQLKLYGSCFCPFVQRVWISLEHKNIPYQYIEVDPYAKPQSLLDVNPRGLVPAIRHGPTWSTHESTVIMEYLEDLQTGPALLPPNAQTRATFRLWADHINRQIIPNFYKLLQAQDQEAQVKHATALRTEISKLVDAAHSPGPFFSGSSISFVDVQIAPWVVRLKKVLGPYRGWPEPEEGSRWKAWVDAIEADRSIKSTTSDDALYLDSYERYAENRPGTSQVADAVNEGRGLP